MAAKLTVSSDDRTLIAEAQLGNPAAFDILVKKYKSLVYRIIVRMIGRGEESNDLTQETFIKAFNSIHNYDPQYQFTTWLLKIATNSSIDHLRRRKINLFSIDQPISGEEGEFSYEIPDTTYEPDRPIVDKEKSEIINEAIGELPEKYQIIIDLRHRQELSYEEISEKLGIPMGTVKAQLFRAREMLYKLLRDREIDLD